jgi:hypothetical protein
MDDTQLARRLQMATVDMHFAKQYLIALINYRGQDDSDERVLDALVISTVVTYARPFTKSHSGGLAAAKISPDDIFLFLRWPELRPLHEKLIELRNQAVAHSDWAYHQTSLDVALQDEGLVLTVDLKQLLPNTAEVLKLFESVSVGCATKLHQIKNP